MSKIKVGIVGLGRLGSVHATNLAQRIPNCELTAACSLSQDELNWAKETLGVADTYLDYNEMIEKADIDAVVIISSSPVHCEQIEVALNNNKHVFVDKPLGCTLEECKRAESAVEAHPEKIFFLGFMRRFDPTYAHAKKQVLNGEIGMPYLIKATGLDPEARVQSCIEFSKTSGGIFIDASSHDIDLMRWYLGSEAVEVYARGTTFKHKEFTECGDTETGMAMITFKNGTVGMLHVGRTAPHGYHIETEIVGTDGHVRVSPVPQKNLAVTFNANGVVTECVENFPERFAEAYLIEMQEFINCIIENRQPDITVYDGTKATEITFAITESFKTQKPVYLNN